MCFCILLWVLWSTVRNLTKLPFGLLWGNLCIFGASTLLHQVVPLGGVCEFADLLWFLAEENMLCIFVRCDLVIAANGNMVKIASGLLEPFLAHLKTARDQIAKGGYSITLKPDPRSDMTWFTKGTVERCVSLLRIYFHGLPFHLLFLNHDS